MRVAFAIALSLPLILTGCALSPTAEPTAEPGVAISGSIHGGQQPINQAHVYLMAAGSGNTATDAGPGIAPSSNNASKSLTISSGSTDSVGSYVLSNSNGGFSFPSGSYSCTPSTQVYIYALGGNPGYGTNSSASLMAALGNCPSSGTFYVQTPIVSVNEVSTIAAAFALAGFASDSTHISSKNTAAAQLGLKNAFANAANLADIPTATALATTPGGNGTAPQQTVNSLANIIAACINSDGTVSNSPSATPCYTLFNNAAVSKTLPSDTATAAINIAQSPASNVDALYRLGTSPPVPFGNALTSEPTDFTLAINYTDTSLNNSKGIAIDGYGYAWVINPDGNSVTVFSPLGTVTSGSGYTDNGNIHSPSGIAIDQSNNAWIVNDSSPGSVSKLSNSGSSAMGSPFAGDANLYSPIGIAIDASGNAWVAATSGSEVTKFSSAGSVTASYGGGVGGIDDPYFDAIDSSGDLWVEDSGNKVTELNNSGGAISSSSGYAPGGAGNLFGGIAIDSSGDAWITGFASGTGTGSVSELSPSGSLTLGMNGITGSGLSGPYGIAMDGSSNAWVANSAGSTVTEISNAGTVLSGSAGYAASGTLSNSYGIAVDGSGDVWIVNNSGPSVTEIIGAATPVVTPLAVGVQNTSLGTRP